MREGWEVRVEKDKTDGFGERVSVRLPGVRIGNLFRKVIRDDCREFFCGEVTDVLSACDVPVNAISEEVSNTVLCARCESSLT